MEYIIQTNCKLITEYHITANSPEEAMAKFDEQEIDFEENVDYQDEQVVEIRLAE